MSRLTSETRLDFPIEKPFIHGPIAFAILIEVLNLHEPLEQRVHRDPEAVRLRQACR